MIHTGEGEMHVSMNHFGFITYQRTSHYNNEIGMRIRRGKGVKVLTFEAVSLSFSSKYST
jgi:hypothetical protein